MKAENINTKKVKFGIKFKDGYTVEAEAETNHQLWPVAVYHGEDVWHSRYYIWDGNAHNQLYGQLMTLVEAVIEEPKRQEAVKSLIRKEIDQFQRYLENEAIGTQGCPNKSK